MKKTNLRMLAILLTLVMMLGLVGCSKETKENPADSTNTAGNTDTSSSNQTAKDDKKEETNTADATTPAPTEEPVAEPEEVYDFGGVVVKVFGSEWNNVDSEETKYVEARDYVEQKYNIKLEKAVMEGYDGYNDDDILISSIAAGDPAAHIINLNPESMVTCYVNDILFDLTDCIDDLQVGHIYTDVATWKGHVYGVAYENIGDTWVLVYDRQLLKDIGMEKTPTDMFMEGKWDYESFRSYCADMKAKLPDGVYPLGCYPFHWAVMAASANGEQIVDVDGNLNLNSEAVIEATDFYQQLEEDQLVFPMWANEDWSDYDLAYAVNDERIVMKRAEVWQLGGLDFDFGIVYWPWGSNVTCTGDYTTLSDSYGTAGVYWGMDAIVAAAVDATGIPGDVLAKIDQDYRCKVADDGFEWMKEAYRQEQLGNFSNEGPEAGEARNFYTEQDVELFDWGHTRYVPDYAWSFSSAGLCDCWGVFEEIFMQYADVRSKLESYQNEGVANLAAAMEE